jgi:hypothetical protein
VLNIAGDVEALWMALGVTRYTDTKRMTIRSKADKVSGILKFAAGDTLTRFQITTKSQHILNALCPERV